MTMGSYPGLDPLDPHNPLRGIEDLHKLNTNELLRRLILEQRRTNLDSIRQSPYTDGLDWAVFPAAGGHQPMLPGKTTFDLEAAQVVLPGNAGTIPLPSNIRNWPIQSLLMWTDAPVTWTIDPSGQGAFSTDVEFVLHGTARSARYLYATAPWPYLTIVVFSPSLTPPEVAVSATGIDRYSDQTVTNPNAYTNINFVAEGTGQTPQATSLGASTIPTTTQGNRLFLVRNAGPASVQVQIHGQGGGLFGDSLDAAGLVGWFLDPDIHAVGGPNASFVTIAAGSAAVLETGIKWSFMRMRAQPASSSGSRLVTEFSSNTVGIR